MRGSRTAAAVSTVIWQLTEKLKISAETQICLGYMPYVKTQSAETQGLRIDLERGNGSQPSYGSNAATKTVWFTGLTDKNTKLCYSTANKYEKQKYWGFLYGKNRGGARDDPQRRGNVPRRGRLLSFPTSQRTTNTGLITALTDSVIGLWQVWSNESHMWQ